MAKSGRPSLADVMKEFLQEYSGLQKHIDPDKIDSFGDVVSFHPRGYPQRVSIRFDQVKKEFIATPTHYPRSKNAAGPYISNQNYGDTPKDALRNLLRAWYTQYITDESMSLTWVPFEG